MAKNRIPCPKHTIGTGPCYCQYRKDDYTYHAPDDVKTVMVNISSIVGRRLPSEMTPIKEKRVRLLNHTFLFSRIHTLSGDNLTRAYKTMENLRE